MLLSVTEKYYYKLDESKLVLHNQVVSFSNQVKNYESR